MGMRTRLKVEPNSFNSKLRCSEQRAKLNEAFDAGDPRQLQNHVCKRLNASTSQEERCLIVSNGSESRVTVLSLLKTLQPSQNYSLLAIATRPTPSLSSMKSVVASSEKC